MKLYRESVEVSDMQWAKVGVEAVIEQSVVYGEVYWRMDLWAAEGSLSLAVSFRRRLAGRSGAVRKRRQFRWRMCIRC